MRILGALRDTQVQLKLIRGEPGQTRALMALVRHLQRRRRRGAREARLALGDDEAVLRLRRSFSGPPPAAERVIRRLRAYMGLGLRETVDSMALLARPSLVGPGARHRARVALRRFDYALEAVRPFWRGDEDGRVCERLRGYQGVIGQIHDRDMLLRRVGQWVAAGRLSRSAARPFRQRLKSERTDRFRASGLKARPLRASIRARA
jgi:CHAD domain-containing protein